MVRFKENNGKKKIKDETKKNIIKFKKPKKKFVLHKKKYSKNPSITHFNISSFFIYDNDEYLRFFNTTTNKNLIKVNKDELTFLQSKYNDISFIRGSLRNIQYIRIPIENYQKLQNFLSIKKIKDPIEDFIKEKINSTMDRRYLSCRKLAQAYKEETGNSVSKSKVNEIIKHKMGYSYLKSTVKTSKILDKENILISLAFIKIISRCIKLGYKIIYVDECGLMTGNNNYRCLRKQGEQIYFNTANKSKRNLLLAVDENKAIYWEILDESTNEIVFLNFIKNLQQKLVLTLYPKYVICMDNHSSHKTASLLNFYKDNKMNILFNSPYVSVFNSVELAFRHIKRILYMDLFSNIGELCSKVENILQSNNFSNTLLYNFGETIEVYIKFIDKYHNIDLNNY